MAANKTANKKEIAQELNFMGVKVYEDGRTEISYKTDAFEGTYVINIDTSVIQQKRTEERYPSAWTLKRELWHNLEDNHAPYINNEAGEFAIVALLSALLPKVEYVEKDEEEVSSDE